MKTAVLLPLLLLGCAMDPEHADEAFVADEGTVEQAATYCLLPSPNTSPDATWTMAGINRWGTLDDYGTGPCDAFVLEVRNVEQLTAYPSSTPTTPDACTGTEIKILRYKETSGGWTYESSETATGVWTFEGCRLPKVAYPGHTRDGIRAHLSVKRTVCTSSGLCSVQRGLPVRAIATTYVPPVPN